MVGLHALERAGLGAVVLVPTMTKREHNPYRAHLKTVKWPTDPKTGGPLPLVLTLLLPGVAECYALLRDLEAGRTPELHIVANQATLPMDLPLSRKDDVRE